MRKVYQILAMAIAVIAMSFSAKADITITLKVDDASRLTGYYQYYDPVTYSPVQVNLDLTQFTGEEGGTFIIPASYGYVYVNATEGNCITSAENAQIYGGTRAEFYVYGDSSISVTSSDLASTRTASCTINIDDASKVSVSYYTGSRVELANGENTIAFNPNSETPLQISHANYGETLYSVKLNGEEQSGYYGRYEVYVADGDVLDIKADFPDEPSVISFSYGENEAEVLGCVSVSVDGVAVEDFDGKSLTVKLGQTVTITGDTDKYNYNYAINVDGESVYFSGEYSFTVTKTEYEIVINATKYATFNVSLTVDNPENIVAYAGNSNDALSLVAGEECVVELSGNSNYINIKPASGCFITSIKVNGEEYGSSYDSYGTTIYNLAENDKIVVVSGKVERNYSAIVWVDDFSAAVYGNSFYGSYDRSSVSVNTGYNTFEFGDMDNPFYLGFYGSPAMVVYQNDELVEASYPGATSYYMTFADQDVVKVFLATADPQTYGVTFSVEGNLPEVTCVKDLIVAVDAWQDGFSTLQGTQVDLATDVEMEVSVNGSKVEAVDGKYSFVVNGDTEVVIAAESSAIDNVEVDAVKDNNVYNLQGILVVKNATIEQIDALPSGLYIINGKKVAVK